MKKISLLLLVFLIPGLLPAQALHEWKGKGAVEGESFETKVIFLKNNNLIVLFQFEDAPIAVEGTWESKDNIIFNLTFTTKTIMGKEKFPIQEGKVYIIDEMNAVILAEGLGIELVKENTSNKGPARLEE